MNRQHRIIVAATLDSSTPWHHSANLRRFKEDLKRNRTYMLLSIFFVWALFAPFAKANATELTPDEFQSLAVLQDHVDKCSSRHEYPEKNFDWCIEFEAVMNWCENALGGGTQSAGFSILVFECMNKRLDQPMSNRTNTSLIALPSMATDAESSTW